MNSEQEARSLAAGVIERRVGACARIVGPIRLGEIAVALGSGDCRKPCTRRDGTA